MFWLEVPVFKEIYTMNIYIYISNREEKNFLFEIKFFLHIQLRHKLQKKN